ncbi:MAG: helix-turn-helix domain-containing protein [Bacteroidetes bacterium]|nr:helix-turn-helix domain-containing protein [Bacteroidota bacterium]
MAGKVAFMLLYFSEYVYGDTSFEFPLSMTDLSDFLNCSRETLSRTINAFAADKIIDKEGRKISILHMDLVQTIYKLG